MAGSQRAAPGAEAGVKVEGGLRRGDIQPGGGEPARHGAADRRVQGPAAGDPFGKFRGLGEGQGGGVLDRGGGGGPDLAGDAQHPATQCPPGGAVRQPGGVGPPAAEGQALAERGRHHGALGGAFSGAEERRRGVIDQVAVDLVGDDAQVVPGRHLAQGPDGGGPGKPAGGVVGQGHNHRADPPPGRPGGGDRAGERSGSQMPPSPGGAGTKWGRAPASAAWAA